jgi:hypothetical protein
MSKFRRSGSDESSSSSSDEGSKVESRRSQVESGEETLDYGPSTFDHEHEVSPLAMMKESSPEAWLGQFLVVLELSTPRGTLEGARRDPELLRNLFEVRERLGASSPLTLLDSHEGAQLRAADWGRWWRAQDELYKYCCAVMALSLLGSKEYISELALMHEQEGNARIKKDAHYVLCHMLEREWPGYEVTKGDLARLQASESKEV